jgi:hypothetical protein
VATGRTPRKPRKKAGARGKARRPAPPDAGARGGEALEGPPPREATILRSDREREVERNEGAYTSTGPELSGGDPDADWRRADSVGEEAVGGTVATPDQSVVDDLGDALGVPRAPDEEVRTSQEMLERRDRHRWEQEV